ncbi:MAG: hypothetical protein IJT16_09275 [Lachnospiraceae bacterium]|nr:hypothetical protein [Lachnospiraceae bacterium]
MVLYDSLMEYKEKAAESSGFDPESLPPEEYGGQKWNEWIAEINNSMGHECGLDGNLSAVISGGKPGKIHILAGCRLEKVTLKECRDFLCAFVKENLRADKPKITAVKEIDSKEFESALKKAYLQDFSHTRCLIGELGLDYFDNCQFHIKEKCFDRTLRVKKCTEPNGKRH